MYCSGKLLISLQLSGVTVDCIFEILMLLLWFCYLQAIFTAGYKAVLHIHSVVEECEIVELLQQIDPKTKKPMKKKVLFVKTNAVVVCRIQVSQSDDLVQKVRFSKSNAWLRNTKWFVHLSLDSQVNNLICVEKFADFPQLGRFTLRTEGDWSMPYHIYMMNFYIVRKQWIMWWVSFTGKTVAVGKITDLPSIARS